MSELLTGPADRRSGAGPERPAAGEPLQRKVPDPLACQFRHHAGKVSRQAAVSLAGTLFLVAGGFTFKIYVSRELGAEGLGIYALGVTVVAFFSIFADLGLSQTAVRFVSIYRGGREPEKIRRFFTRCLTVLLVSCGVLSILMLALRRFIAVDVYDEPELARYLPYFALLLALGTINTFLGQYLRGHQEVTRRTIISSFVVFPVRVVLTVVLFSQGFRLAGYVAAAVGSALLATLLFAVLAVRLTDLRAVDSAPAARGFGREEYVYAASMTSFGILSFATGKVDQVLIGVFLAAEQVGIYSIALTAANFVPTLLQSLNSIFGPMIADLHSRRQTQLLERLFQTSTKWCFGLTWPLVVVIVFFARDFMGLFGPGFEAGAPVLAILALAQVVNVGVGSVGHLLLMSGHQRLEILSTVAAAVSILPLTVVLIPRWGVLGAAAALAGGLIVSNLLRAWLVWARLRLLPYNRGALRLLPPVAASTLLTFGVWWWWRPRVGFEAMPGVLAGAYAAFIVTAAAFTLDRDDRIILRAVAERVRGYLGR